MGKGKTPKGTRVKTTKRHTTAIPAVETLLKQLNRMESVEKVSLGIIKAKLRPGARRVKIVPQNDKVVLVRVRDVNTLQEVRVFSTDVEQVELTLEIFAKRMGWGITKS